MYHTIYLITNILNNKKYIGYTSKSIDDRLSGHLWEARNKSKYWLHKAIRKYGWDGNFTINILYMSKDGEHTRSVMEPYFIKEYNTYGKNLGYNMTMGGDGSPTTLSKSENINKAKKGKSNPWMVGRQNTKGSKWYTDGVNNILILEDSPIPENYRSGRTLGSPNRTKKTIRPKFTNGYKPSNKSRIPMSESHKQQAIKNLINQRNYIWINNGVVSKRIPKEETIPDTYSRGRAKF